MIIGKTRTNQPVEGSKELEVALVKNVTDLYLELEGEEPTQAQLEQVYTQKPDILRIGMGSDENVITLYKSMQREDETRLNYFNVQTSEGVIQVLKIEYSEEDGYIIETYDWTLENMGGGNKLYKHQLTISCSGAGFTGNIKLDVVSQRSTAYDKSSLEGDATLNGYYPFLKQNSSTMMWGLAVDGSYFVLDVVNKGIMTNGLLSSSISSITNDVVTAL